MIEWGVSIVIGVVGSILAVYLKESLRFSRKQKITIIQLESYLRFWRSIISKDPYIKMIAFLLDVNEKIINSFETDGIDEAVKSLKNKLVNIEGFRQKILDALEGNDEIKTLNGFNKSLEKDSINVIKKGILENKIFLSDKEVSCLPIKITQKVIRVKLRIILLLDKLSYLIFITEQANQQKNEIIADIGVLLLKIFDDLLLLSNETVSFGKKSFIALTVKNLFC